MGKKKWQHPLWWQDLSYLEVCLQRCGPVQRQARSPACLPRRRCWCCTTSLEEGRSVSPTLPCPGDSAPCFHLRLRGCRRRDSLAYKARAKVLAEDHMITCDWKSWSSTPVMGASGFSQLIKMEVSPTSSTSWSEGASGATDRPRCESKNTKTDVLED